MLPSVKHLFIYSPDSDDDKLLEEAYATLRSVVECGLELLYGYKDKIKDWVNDINVPTFMSLRRAVDLFDAISILVRYSSVESCWPLVRSLLDVYINVEYLLRADIDQRAKAFMVFSFHDAIDRLEKSDPTTERFKALKRSLDRDNLFSDITWGGNPGMGAALQDDRAALVNDRYKECEGKYNDFHDRFKRWPSSWFELYAYYVANDERVVPIGTSIEEIAKGLGMPGLYDIWYRPYSSVTHGTDIVETYPIRGGHLIVPIRHPVEAVILTLNIGIIAKPLYHAILREPLTETEMAEKVALWENEMPKLMLPIINHEAERFAKRNNRMYDPDTLIGP